MKQLAEEIADKIIAKFPNEKFDYNYLVQNIINSIENSKYEKTKIACVGSVLNPGVANGVHIRDSHWISKETINNSQALKLIYDYIDNILTQK